MSRLTRPFTIMNMAISADGKTSTRDREKLRFGSKEDRRLMEELRTRADAVMIGRGTLDADDPPLLVRDSCLQEQRLARGEPIHPINVAVCSQLPPGLLDSAFCLEKTTTKIIYTTVASETDSLSTPPDVCVDVVARDSAGRVQLTEVVGNLASRGVTTLLLEGGGTLNYSMLQQSLVDEVFMTVCPFLFGGQSAPTSLDGVGFAKEQVKRLRLCSCRSGTGGEVFLHYRVTSDSVPVRKSRVFDKGFEISDSY